MNPLIHEDPARYGVRQHRFTVNEYMAAVEAGVLSPDDRVELIAGVIIEMGPTGEPHAAIVERLARIFYGALGSEWIVRVQSPFKASDDSMPEPDLFVARKSGEGGPRGEDILLAVEVSHTSKSYDAQVKAPLYARSGIRELWIFDVSNREVLIHEGPQPDGSWEHTKTCGPGEVLRSTHVSGLEMKVEDVLR
jgi:Uma2 family endonuclease